MKRWAIKGEGMSGAIGVYAAETAAEAFAAMWADPVAARKADFAMELTAEEVTD